MTTEKHVWIVLTGTGTWFSRMIRCFTNAPLNHASIAFDAELREVYSFGRKQPNNPWDGGLVRENLRSPFFSSADSAVYLCRVSSEDYQRMYGLVQDMMQEQHRYKYNLLGLLGILFRVHIDRDYAFFCSHFVATVLERAGLRFTGKPAHLITPSDIAESPQMQEIYRGPLHGFVHPDFTVTGLSATTSSRYPAAAEPTIREKLFRFGRTG